MGFNLSRTNMTMNRGNLPKSLTLRNSRRDRRLSSDRRLLRRVLTLRPLLANILPLSACTPNMNVELTPEPMTTERNSMRVVGKSSELNPLMPSGRRSTKNGLRDQQRNFPNGLVRDLARKLEMLKPQRVRNKVVRKQLQKRKTIKKKRRRKKKRKRRKSKHCR